MREIVDVEIGDVKVGKRIILKSAAIASCIVITAYDSKKKIGALAHIMLPGHSPKKSEFSVFQKTRYAYDAVDEMINRITQLGADRNNIETCLVGGANVLKKENDTICEKNISSVVEIMNKKRIKIGLKILGGTARRSVSFDAERGELFCAEGDGSEKLLWKAIPPTGE